MPPACQVGPDHLGNMLGTRGGEEQHLGGRIHLAVLKVKQQAADQIADLGAAWLFCQDRRVARGVKALI